MSNFEHIIDDKTGGIIAGFFFENMEDMEEYFLSKIQTKRL